MHIQSLPKLSSEKTLAPEGRTTITQMYAAQMYNYIELYICKYWNKCSIGLQGLTFICF